MNAVRERTLIRTLHLILSIPILGYLYGPVSRNPTGGRVYQVRRHASGHR